MKEQKSQIARRCGAINQGVLVAVGSLIVLGLLSFLVISLH